MQRRWWILGGIVLVGALGFGGWIWRQPLTDQVTSFSKRVGGNSAWHFAVVGDSHGVNPIYTEIIKRIADEDYAFLLHLADTSEFGTREEFQALRVIEQSLPFPVYHTVGNHDIQADPSREIFREVFQQAPWGAYTIHGLRLLLLDNADRKVGFPDEELEWLAAQLKSPSAGPTIIAYHRPFDLPLAAILGDDETAASRVSNTKLMDLLADHPIDMIFSAHLHTFLEYRVGDIPAVVTGGGGDPAQSVLGGSKNNYFHYLDVRVEGKKLTVEVKRIELTE